MTPARLTAAQIACARDGLDVGALGSAALDPSRERRLSSERILAAIDTSLQGFSERPHYALAVLPEDDVKKTVVPLPQVSPRKSRRILRNRALQIAGLPEENLVWDAIPLGSFRAEGKDIAQWMVLTACRATVHAWHRAFRKAGIRLAGILPPTPALLNLSRFRDRGPASSEAVGELIVGHEHAVLNIVSGSSLLISRTLRFDPKETPQDGAELLSGELQRSFMYCNQNLMEITPSAVDLIHAGGKWIDTIARGIERGCELPVRVLDAASWIRWEVPPAEVTGGDGHGLPLLVLLGAGAGSAMGKGCRPNLLPKDIRPRNWSVTSKVATSLALVAIGFLIYKLHTALVTTVRNKQEILREQQDSRRSLLPILDSLREIETHTTFLKSIETKAVELVGTTYDWSSLFQDLAGIPPGEIRFSRIDARRIPSSRFQPGKGKVDVEEWSLTVELQSPWPYRKAQEVVQELIHRLRRSHYFKAVNLRPPSRKGMPDRSQSGRESVFVIDCKLSDGT